MISDKAEICPNCGYPIGKEKNLSSDDNEETNKTAEAQNNDVQRHICIGTDLTDGGTCGKNRLTFCFLAFFFGLFGVHLFYIGRGKSGMLNVGLIIAILFISLILSTYNVGYGGPNPAIILFVWLCYILLGIMALLTLYQILAALAMTQEKFEDKYV